ncbi:MAG: hypothetical protein AAB495_01775 [Patescibacteria group bacterium]
MNPHTFFGLVSRISSFARRLVGTLPQSSGRNLLGVGMNKNEAGPSNQGLKETSPLRVKIIVVSAIALGFIVGAFVYWYWIRPEQVFAPEKGASIEETR